MECEMCFSPLLKVEFEHEMMLCPSESNQADLFAAVEKVGHALDLAAWVKDKMLLALYVQWFGLSVPVCLSLSLFACACIFCGLFRCWNI